LLSSVNFVCTRLITADCSIILARARKTNVDLSVIFAYVRKTTISCSATFVFYETTHVETQQALEYVRKFMAYGAIMVTASVV
jgi:hypothetical protein